MQRETSKNEDRGVKWKRSEMETRVQSENKIDRKFTKYKFGKNFIFNWRFRAEKNGQKREGWGRIVKGGKSSEAGACHKCAQHRTLLDYKPTLLLFVQWFSVTAVPYTRSCAMEALDPLRNGCTFLVRSPVNLANDDRTRHLDELISLQLVPHRCHAN